MTDRKAGLVWTLRVMIALSLLGFVAGCRTEPVELRPPPPSIRVAVLDFAIPPGWIDNQNPDQTDKEMQGWWFGSRDIWRNPGLGRMAGDVFAHEIAKLPFVSIVSRIDIKYYMARKRDQIRRIRSRQRREFEESGTAEDLMKAERIRQMTDADYDAELLKLPPWEIGRELKVDRVLVGRILDSYLAHNRTINWYWTYVDLEADLYDVDTGKVVWHKRAQFKKSFASAMLVLEEASVKMIDMMKAEYFYPPSR